MNGRQWVLLLFLSLLAASSAAAARIYEIDPETGQTAVIDTAAEEEPVSSGTPAAEEQPAACSADEAEIRRLRSAIMRQQRSLQRQQALIVQLRKELRKKDDIIRGLDLLRRQGR